MNEDYPEKQKGLKTMFFVICFICIVQFFLIAWMAGKMEFFEVHIFDLNKRVLNIESRFSLD